MSEFAQRRAVVQAARDMLASRLTSGTSGNVSVRTGGGFLITPTGIAPDAMEPGDLVVLDGEGRAIRGGRTPSSEWRIHRDIYAARADAGAVIHAHPPFCCTIAALRRDLPAVHYMIAVAGGPVVRCAAYATYGTAELSASVLAALESRKACLLASHGLVTLGADLAGALRVAREIELVAEIYWRSLAAGSPVVLDDAEMERVMEKFSTYGQRP